MWRSIWRNTAKSEKRRNEYSKHVTLISVRAFLRFVMTIHHTVSKSTSTRTIASDVFEQLRGDILECRLAPGTRLRFKDLRARYGSGLSPLREALMRLVADDLVVLEDHK